LLASDGIAVHWADDVGRFLAVADGGGFFLAVMDSILLRALSAREASATLAMPMLVLLGQDTSDEWNFALQSGALQCLPPSAGITHIHLQVRNYRRALLTPGSASAGSTRTQPQACPVLDAFPGVGIMADSCLRVAYANTATSALAGCLREALIGNSLEDMFSRQSFKMDLGSVRTNLLQDGAWQGELRGRHSNGKETAFWGHATSLRSTSPDARYMLFLYDISHIKHREQRLRTLAETDALTGIANRNVLLSRLEDAISVAACGGEHPTVLFIDLDGFKVVNDRLGHGRGDQVLRTAAIQLSSVVRADDLVARFGGDEFVILLKNSSRPAVEEMAQRILERLTIMPSTEDEEALVVTCSIGISRYPDDGLDASSLIKRADKAMYRAKDGNKNNYFFAGDHPGQA